LIEKIAASESEIEIAVDEEDYDRAAELSEVVDASKEQLQAVCLTPLVFALLSPPLSSSSSGQQVLQTLAMSKEEVEAH
jgi:hypothetical protein